MTEKPIDYKKLYECLKNNDEIEELIEEQKEDYFYAYAKKQIKEGKKFPKDTDDINTEDFVEWMCKEDKL